MVDGEKRGVDKGELLISKWFPITEVSVESVRERTPGTPFSPLSRIHVWFARRPLTTSRAAVLLSLLPSHVNREVVLRLLGIPIGVDLRKAEEEIVKAKAAGIRLKYNPFHGVRLTDIRLQKMSLLFYIHDFSNFGVLNAL